MQQGLADTAWQPNGRRPDWTGFVARRKGTWRCGREEDSLRMPRLPRRIGAADPSRMPLSKPYATGSRVRSWAQKEAARCWWILSRLLRLCYARPWGGPGLKERQ